MAWQHSPTHCSEEPRHQKKWHCVWHIGQAATLGPREVLWPQRAFLLKKLLLFVSFCTSPIKSPFCQLVLFLLCLNAVYLFCLLLHFCSISYSAFPFAFLYKVPLIDHCLECNCFSFTTCLLIYSSFSGLDFSISFLLVRQLMDNTRHFSGKEY